MGTDDKHADREATLDAMAREWARRQRAGWQPLGVVRDHMRSLLDGKAPGSDADRAALAILQPPDDHKPDGEPYDANAAAHLEASMMDSYDVEGERRRLADWEHESRRIAEGFARLGTDKRGGR